MNIWLFHHYAIPPSSAGITRHFSLAREMVKRGHKVTVIAANISHRNPAGVPLPDNAPFKKEEIDQVTFLWLKAASGAGGKIARVWNMLIFAGRILCRTGLETLEKPDIVIGSSPDLFTALAAHITARRQKAASITLVGDLWPLALVEIGGISRFHPFILLLQLVEYYLYKKSDAVISPQKNGYRYISRHGAKTENVFWVPNGVDAATLPPVSNPPRHNAFEVMYAGSLGPSNGLEALIETAALLKEKNIVLRLMGTGAYVGNLKSKAANLENVVFEEAVAKEGVHEKLCTADAFIVNVPDLAPYRYGLGLNKIYDYMAAGRPTIIAAPRTHNPITEAFAGIAVPANDAEAIAGALVALAAMPAEERRKMGMNGRTSIERFYNFENIGDMFESALLQTLDRVRSTP